MESSLSILSDDIFLSRLITNRAGRLVRKYGNKYKILSANLVKTGGFRDQISTKTHAAISF